MINLYKSWAHISLALSTGNFNILKSPITTPKHPTLESALKNYKPISQDTCTGYKVNHLYLRDGYGYIIDVGKVE